MSITSLVRYIGATQDQIDFGGWDDPREVLEINKIYEAYNCVVGPLKSYFELVGIHGRFNTVHFEPLKRYRKRPVIIEAVQWFKHGDHPKVFRTNVGDNVCDCHENHGIIETLEGPHYVSPGDWIIQGIKGEFYPCKPDIFEKTYEEV